MSTTPSAHPSTSSSPGSLLPPGSKLWLQDSLREPGKWNFITDPDDRASCGFTGGRMVTTIFKGTTSYRCQGPKDLFTNFVVTVDVTLLEKDTCGAIWFLFNTKGYLLKVCPEGFYLDIHGDPDPATVRPLTAYDFSSPLRVGRTITVGIKVVDHEISVYRDGRLAGEPVLDGNFTTGHIVLGAFVNTNTLTPGQIYRAGFANIKEYKVPPS